MPASCSLTYYGISLALNGLKGRCVPATLCQGPWAIADGSVPYHLFDHACFCLLACRSLYATFAIAAAAEIPSNILAAWMIEVGGLQRKTHRKAWPRQRVWPLRSASGKGQAQPLILVVAKHGHQALLTHPAQPQRIGRHNSLSAGMLLAGVACLICSFCPAGPAQVGEDRALTQGDPLCTPV